MTALSDDLETPSESRPLAGLRAIGTGASRGIGPAVAPAESEASVCINYRSVDAKAVAKRCRAAGVDVRLGKADVSDRAEVERVVAETVEAFGRIDVAISNAAFSHREPFHTADMALFERTVGVTMWSPFYLLRAATNHMLVRGGGGSVVVVSSPHAYRPLPNAMAYGMAKAAVDQMCRTAATELVRDRIRVNVVHPGRTDTPGERAHFSEEEIASLGPRLPWGRLGRPEEIARAVVFFADPRSDYMTGSHLLIDGGLEFPVAGIKEYGESAKGF